MRSEAVEIAEAFETHPNLTTDAGAVLFGDAVTITADGPWQHMLHQLTGRKWGNLDVENETGCGIVPYVYRDRHTVNAVQWAVGLELLLLIKDPWRVFLTTDHPNGGCFWRYPEIIRLLMDAEFRKEQIKSSRPRRRRASSSATSTGEYTLSEIAIITSAGPARALGLSQKGHLGVGADADVTIYPAKPRRTSCCSRIRATSSRAARSWSKRERSAPSAKGGSSSSVPAMTNRSRSSSGRCSRRSTRCRSRTIPWRSSAFAAPKS